MTTAKIEKIAAIAMEAARKLRGVLDQDAPMPGKSASRSARSVKNENKP
jgi:hypothetical protein